MTKKTFLQRRHLASQDDEGRDEGWSHHRNRKIKFGAIFCRPAQEVKVVGQIGPAGSKAEATEGGSDESCPCGHQDSED